MSSTSRTGELLATLGTYWAPLLVSFIAYWLLQNYFKRGLNKVPGPWYRGVITLPRIWSVYKGQCHEDDIALHKKYGKVVRLAPNLVSVSDPREINHIYGIGTKFIKSGFYKLVEEFDDEGVVPDPFVMTDKDLHSRMKRSAANAYSMAGLVKMEPWVDDVTGRLVKRLEGYAESGKGHDISALMAMYAMDAVTALTFGKDFDHMEHGDLFGMLKSFKIANDYMAVFGQFAWCHRFLLGNAWLAKMVFRGDSSARMMQLAYAEMEAGRSRTDDDSEGPLTFMQRVLLNQKQNPKILTDREVMTHSFNNVAAGSDTTATALRSIIFNSLRDRAVYERLRAEVRGAVTELPVSFATANALPYLGAVIKEGIRVHPSVGMLLGRVVPAGGATICGHHLAAGAEVGVNPWVVQRDPEVYTDPDRFYPERWLPENTSEEQLKLMNRSFIPFGHGAHTCSGRWISMMEMYKVVATMFALFDMELVDGGRAYNYHNLWFVVQKNLQVRFKKVSR